MPLPPPVTTATRPSRRSTSVLADGGQVVVALVDVRRQPVGGHGRHDLAGLDAAALGDLDRADGADRQVGDRVEARLAQDDLAVDALELARRLVAAAVDELRLPVEALAVHGGQELDVEARARAVRRRL